jgi:hypothetical protein
MNLSFRLSEKTDRLEGELGAKYLAAPACAAFPRVAKN